ncbi:MAG: 1,5-anhydro-D-fructose reductase [Vulcanimicrobiaceae bacterium]
MVRWGIAGYGWLARDYADPALRALTDARLVGACDLDPAARDLARSRGLTVEADLDALCDRVDAIYVATPNHTHRTLVERAAARGRAVLCEKPMATTLADGEAMLAACARANVAYATAYDQRYHPAHRALRALVAAGELGTVTAVRIVYACWLPARWSGDNWRVDPSRSGGGALVDLAPHGLDLVAMLLGDPIVEARALGQRRVHAYGVDDGAAIVARTEGDVLAQLHVAYNHAETLPRRRLELVGTRGIATALDTMGQTPGGSLAVRDAATGETRAIPFDSAASPFAGLVAAFTRSLLAGARFDVAAAERERASLAIFDGLVRDVAREVAACR